MAPVAEMALFGIGTYFVVTSIYMSRKRLLTTLSEWSHTSSVLHLAHLRYEVEIPSVAFLKDTRCRYNVLLVMICVWPSKFQATTRDVLFYAPV